MYNKSRVLHAYKGDKHSDADRQRFFDTVRYAADDRFSQPAGCDENKKNAGNKNNCQSFLIGHAKAYHNRKGEKGVKSHSRSLSQRQSGVQGH